MQIGMIGLGRMGGDMVRRLLHSGHECVVFDIKTDAVAALATEGAEGSRSIEELVSRLVKPRVVWLMVPAALTEAMITTVTPLLDKDDIIIDGGNAYYRDDIRRSAQLQEQGIHYLDVGTSGGIWGAERGYCLMIGGETSAVELLDPIFAALSPGIAAAPAAPGREKAMGTAAQGYLHCGPSGAGHFVKMVHNGIEYGLMAAYAEGVNILRHANVGKEAQEVNAETTPLRHPEHYQYDFNLVDILEVWRRGSVISSWLLDLAANAVQANPDLDNFKGRVSDSGEGRWAAIAAVEEGVPAFVLSAALFERFSSRGEADFGDRLLSAMRYGFGGHLEKSDEKNGGAR